MAGEWRTATIGEIANVVGGSTPSTKDATNFGGNIPWLTPKDLSGHHNRFIASGNRNLTVQGLENCSARLVPSGTVLLSTRAPIGYVAIAANDIATNQGFRSLVLREGNSPEFLYYWLKCNVPELERHASGSTFRELSGTSLKCIRVLLPPLPEQCAIAHILGTLDDKIELNRRMNKTLEAMARALFKSWFIDFDPVCAKMEGRNTRLPRHLANLFPDRLVDSELGEIPEGWEVGCVGDVFEHLHDKENPLASPDLRFRHFSIPAFDNGQWPTTEFGRSIKSQKSKVPPGVILLSKLNPEIERVWAVDVNEGDRPVCSTEFLVLRPRVPFGRTYVYCLVRSFAFRRNIQALVTGTSKSHQRARAEAILNLPTVLPPALLSESFESIVDVLLCRTMESRRESRGLAALRDTLLPKLIVGKIRLRHAEVRRWMEGT